jgi:hypothetical protein
MPETKKTKIDFIQNFPEWVSNHKSDKDIYFYTVTFKEPKRELPHAYYEEFFRYQRQRLDNALLSNSRRRIKAPFFILVPEANPYLHFHGFICVHKETSERFYKKCIAGISYKDANLAFRLKENILNPYPEYLCFRNQQATVIKQTRYKNRTSSEKRFLLETQPLLSIADYKLHPISNEEEIYATSFYSNKKYVQSNFSSDEIIIETKKR